MVKTQPEKALAGGCLSLFGLPFLAAGLFMSGWYFHSLLQCWSAGGWDEVPCRIESAEIRIARDSDGDSARTTAIYHYEYGGRSYQGDRVSFYTGGDNIGGFQRRAHRELSAYVSKGPVEKDGNAGAGAPRRFRCYVNPRNPSVSVLYRAPRWEMQGFMAVFALTFPAVGAGLVFGGVVSVVASRRENALVESHPCEPWKWKWIWLGRSIPESAGRWCNALHFYTLWSGSIILPLVGGAALSGAFAQGGGVWWLWIFPALWCIPAFASLKRLRHALAVGSARLELKESPVLPGGALEGAVLLQRPPPARLTAELELVCEKSTTRPSSDGDSTTTEKLWSHRETVPLDAVTRDVSGYRLPVKFSLPADAPDSGSSREPSVSHAWKLGLKVPGSPIDATFELPVFRTGKSPVLSAATSSGTPSVLDEAEADLPALLAARRIRAEFDASGFPFSILCPPARHFQLILFMVSFDAVWTGIAVMLFKKGAPLPFLILWPLSAAGIWLAVIWQCLHTRKVTFSHDGLQVRDQFGPVIWTKRFEKAHITGFGHNTNMTSGKTTYYRVRLQSVHGKTQTLADGITESATAAALVKRMEDWRAG